MDLYESVDVEVPEDGLFADADRALLERFRRYHEANQNVYEDFLRHSRAAKMAGRKKYSPWIIINVMRWSREVVTQGDTFKISNDYIALYSRLVIHCHPEFEGFFDLKQMKRSRKDGS